MGVVLAGEGAGAAASGEHGPGQRGHGHVSHRLARPWLVRALARWPPASVVLAGEGEIRDAEKQSSGVDDDTCSWHS